MSAKTPANAQHYLNPLHVYCRLCDLGLPSTVARAVSSGYERVLYRPAANTAQDQNGRSRPR